MTESEPNQSVESVRSEGMPGVALMVLGVVVAVLGPLFGLLAGSMVGSPDPDSTGPLFEYLIGGLLVGAVGVVILYLGFVRYRRLSHNRESPPR